MYLLSWLVLERDTCVSRMRSLDFDGERLRAVFDDYWDKGDTCGTVRFVGVQLYRLPDDTPEVPVQVTYLRDLP